MIFSAGKIKIGLLLIILALVVVILGLSWLAVSWSDQPQDLAAPLSNSSSSGLVSQAPVSSVQQNSGLVQRTTLTDPTGNDVLGELTKESPQGDDHRLKLVMNLPAPGGNEIYTVWLMQTTGAEEKMLGRLSADGARYVADFTSREEEQNFDRIVISVGPEADEKIVNIVAEGDIGQQLLL